MHFVLLKEDDFMESESGSSCAPTPTSTVGKVPEGSIQTPSRESKKLKLVQRRN